MRLSVLIPTFRRPEAINACLAHLALASCAHEFEIIVGLDGPASDTPDPVIPASIADRVRVIRYPRLGLIGVRNSMLGECGGEIVLWLNDDAYASPGLLEIHLGMHQGDAPRVIAGRAVWKPIERADLFDRLVQETDLIFFSQRDEPQPRRIDYRNCFGINMSFPRALAMEVGGLAQVEERYGYEDIELAWRLQQAGASIWYAPAAVVTHDHRFRPRDLHRREYLLGRAAFAFAMVNPGFTRALFGRDIIDPGELAYVEQALHRERRDAARIERSFLSLTEFVPESVDPALLPLLTEHWVLLKRHLWRWGLLDASRGLRPAWSLLKEQ